jgi:DNA polymerase-3 subunit epsilon/CBS domain-containing protein
MPLADAIRILVDRKVSSAFVRGVSGEMGIVTERDLLRAINAGGAAALSLPVDRIMTAPLQSVAADAFLYRATARLDRLGFRHLGVHDADGQIVGAMTMRNLLRQRASSALIVGDEIDSARTAADLASAFGKLAPMSESLLAEDVDPRNVAAIISSEICAITAKAAQFAEARMAEAGQGPPPVSYCVLVLGSAGRGESLLAADQDNAIVFEAGEPGGVEDRWFAAMAQHMNEMLDEAGVVLCKGGVMAKNQQWRHSLDGWKAVIDGWIGRQSAQDLLNVDIFFDGVVAHGDRSLGDAVWTFAQNRAQHAPDFIKMLSVAAADWRPPLTVFGNIRADEGGRTDLKKGGLMPILIAGRALAIRHGVRERATPDRLRGVAAMGIGSPEEVEGIVDAHRVILGEILSQQLQDHAQGVPLSTRVEIRRLGKPRAAALRKALEAASAAVAMLGQGTL